MTPDDHDLREILSSAPLTVIGQMRAASNASLVCTASSDSIQCMYKPVAGERPLWDFPEGTLGHREVAAHDISSRIGWSIIPLTVWRQDGPYGPGMCQLWIDADETGPVALVSSEEATGRIVLEGQDSTGRQLALVHEDTADLQRVALFDAVVNNADRKGGHVLRDQSGRLWAIDHGVTFAEESKLRTVLWGWAGEPIPVGLLGDLRAFRESFLRDPGSLADHLTSEEVEAITQRIDELLAQGTFPLPSDGWPAVPWPIM